MTHNTPPTIGRPSSYNVAVADDILQRIAKGESLRRICAEPEMPAISTVLRWAGNSEGGFRDLYTRACEARALLLVEEILELADSATQADAHARRLQVESRKWIASKLWPKVFGDRVQTDVQQLDANGKPAAPVQPVLNIIIETKDA